MQEEKSAHIIISIHPSINHTIINNEEIVLVGVECGQEGGERKGEGRERENNEWVLAVVITIVMKGEGSLSLYTYIYIYLYVIIP